MYQKLLNQFYRIVDLAVKGVLLQAIFINILSASAVINAQEVKSVNEITIDLRLTNASLEKVFNQIEQQTGLKFTYNTEDLPGDLRLNINKKQVTLGSILQHISRDASLKFKQINRNISVTVLQKDERIQQIEILIQSREVSGKVISGDDQEPLPGVNVVEKGTTNGTVSNLEGEYNLTVSDGATIVFSSVGFTSEELVVGSRSVIDLSMTPDIQQLQELVVIGYGTQEKRDLTGSAIRADIESFREAPNVNIAQSLQGTVPGLNIGAVDAAGENPSISVRGATTINGNQNVLIVLDGIIYTGNISSLNPNDIESIDVLKDPSSMAIFGAQAANGVMLITSKEGKKSQKPVFNYSASYTTQDPAAELTLLNREEYLNKLRDNAWEEAYLAPDFTTPNPNFDLLDLALFPPIRVGIEEGNEYDWWENATHSGYINSHNLSVRGTSGDIAYFISGGLTDQKGYILNDKFKRVTTRINISNNVLDWFKVGVQTFGSFSDYSGESPTLGAITTMSPVSDPFDADGNYDIGPNGDITRNPYIATLADNFDKRNSLFGNFYLDLDIPFIQGLNYRLNFGNNYAWNREFSSNLYSGSTTAGEAIKENSSRYDWTVDHIINYKKAIGNDHAIDLTLVAGQREIMFENTTARGNTYNNIRLSYNDLSLGGVQQIQSSAWDESYLYQTVRLNYEYKMRYLLTATVRRDGFSGFAKNEKFGIFPSLGLGWIISEEDFMSNTSFDNLKIRASYGENGNLVDRYSSLAVLQSYSAYTFGDGGPSLFGQRITRLGNPNLGWETTTGINIGVDFSIMKSRFSGSVDYYATTTNDLIFDVAIPSLSGFDEITTNVGEVANRGLELFLNSQILEKGKFNWDLNFNFATNNNKIESLIGLDANNDGIEDDLIASNLFIGESINSIFGYESDGRYQVGDQDIPAGFTVGTDKIIDQNTDGFIDPLDRVIRGRQEPAYRFGVMNELRYGDFTFRFFINSVQGGKNGYRQENRPFLGNQEQHFRANTYREVDYWTPLNPNSRYPALNQTAATTFMYLGNRSFVRLQDVTLAYNLNASLIEKLGLQSCKVFLSGKNLHTWTQWQGWDPETGEGLENGGRPVLRGVSIGLDVSF